MQRIDFEDLPSTNTPVNAENLNLLQDNVEDEIDTKTATINELNRIGTQKQVFGDVYDSDGTYTATIYSNLVATYIGNSIWRIDFDSKLEYSTTPGADYYYWGFSIDKIGTLLNLSLENITSGYNKLSNWKTFDATNGTIDAGKYGYAPLFEYNVVGNKNLLIPARYYNASGSTGGWGLSTFASGNIFTGTIYLKEQE